MSADEIYMKEAIKEAEKSLKRGNRGIGCVLVLDGKIVARGYPTKHESGNRFAHAEINAIHSVGKLISENPGKVEIYSTMEPCPMCLSTIRIGMFKRLIYGIKDLSAGAITTPQAVPPHFMSKDFSFKITSGVLEKRCTDVYALGPK